MIARITLQSQRTAFTSSVLAVIGACLAGAVLLLLTGHNPWTVYRLIVERGLLDLDGLTESLKKMAPLLTITAGLLICLRAGIWNIGIDGQVVTGAIACGVVAGELAGSVPRAVLLIIGVLAGALAGSLWALGPAVLTARFGLNEIITTVMMNYLAFNLVSWLVKGPFKAPEIVTAQTKQIPVSDRLPDLPWTDIHIGLIAGLIVILVVWLVFRDTVPGTMLDVLGRNRRASVHAGFPVTRLIVGAFLVSGGAAGLAGAIDVLGVHGLFKASYQPGYGFTAFALAYLARLRALAVVPFAAFLSVLVIGGDSMSRRADVPTEFVSVLEGLMLIFFALVVWFEARRAA
jgi:general nucleoside transport system permease protein